MAALVISPFVSRARLIAATVAVCLLAVSPASALAAPLVDVSVTPDANCQNVTSTVNLAGFAPGDVYVVAAIAGLSEEAVLVRVLADGTASQTFTFTSQYAGIFDGRTLTVTVLDRNLAPLAETSATVSCAPPMPTSPEQCKNGGFQAVPAFKNQGDCVSFVSTGQRNLPAQ